MDTSGLISPSTEEHSRDANDAIVWGIISDDALSFGGLMKIQTLVVRGDEWWLNPEFQPDHETRQEWRSRTFAFHYGRGPRKFSDYLNSFVAPNAEKQSEAAAKVRLVCPPGFIQFQDSCMPEGSEE